PAGIAVDPGDATRPPVIAVRTDRDNNVLIYTLSPSNKPAPLNDFTPTPNFADVGGVPSDIVFVSTNQGRRLAAMVPSPMQTAVLIKVDDSQTLPAALAAPYQKLALVTGVVSGASSQGD